MKDELNMLSVREIAKTGLLNENALRRMIREGRIEVVYIGKKALINYDKLVESLKNLNVDLQQPVKWQTNAKIMTK